MAGASDTVVRWVLLSNGLRNCDLHRFDQDKRSQAVLRVGC
jgi:hypothetical protein